MKDILYIAVLIISILASVVSLVSVIVLIKHRTDTLKEGETRLTADLEKTTTSLQEKIDDVFDRVSGLITRIEDSFKEDIRRATAQLGAATATIQGLQIEQSLFNKFTTDTIKSLTAQMEKLQDKVNEQETRLSVLER